MVSDSFQTRLLSSGIRANEQTAGPSGPDSPGAKACADIQVNGKSNGQTKRSRDELDADGDVVMGQEADQRGIRGGKSLRRKKRRGLLGADVEMEDAEVGFISR